MTALYLLGAVLVVLVLGVMVAPLFQDEGPAVEMEALPARERREAALEAVREVQFEHETGKMAEEEFRRLRAHYGRMALEAGEELEAAGEAVPESGEDRVGSEAAGAGSTAEGDGKDASSCPECGAEVRPGGRFCPRCGTRQPASPGEGGDG